MQSLAMFPGQGSQYVGMANALVREFTYAEEIFAQASDAIDVNILKLCNEGPDSELALTANTQPCILTVSNAIWTVLKMETDFEPACFAGHSLGEYSALVAAEKLNFTDAVKLVRERGKFMQAAVPEGVGAMAAVLSCPVETLQASCDEFSSPQNKAEIVNYNSPMQLVIAGHKKAVEQVSQKLSEEKFRVVPLNVSAPFHSSLMLPAKEGMQPLLKATVIHSTRQKLIPNTTAHPSADYSADLLVEQIASAVKWTQSMQAAYDLGIRSYVEVGPGKVLQGLIKRILPKEVVSENTDNLLDYLNKQNSKN